MILYFNYESIIEYWTKRIVEIKLSNGVNGFSQKDMDYYYNNPQIRFHLIFKQNSFVKKKFNIPNNQYPKSNNLIELITESEFKNEIENDNVLAEIIYKSIYFLTNLKVLMIVQLVRLIIFIGFLISFYFFLKKFYKDWYHILYVMCMFIVSIVVGNLLIHYLFGGRMNESACGVSGLVKGNGGNVEKQENLKILCVQRKNSKN